MAKARIDSKGKQLREQGRKWIERVKAAEKHEKEWLDDAHAAAKAYTNEQKADNSDTLGTTYDYNILFANVETIVPAVINSPPVPDIRRRFGDADEAARVVADIYERVMRTQIDDSRLQTELEAMAQDSFLAGRGIIRIRFESDIVGGELSKEDIQDASEAADGYESDDADAERTGTPGAYQAEDDAIQLAASGSTSAGALSGLNASGEPGAALDAVGTERLENERIPFEAVSWRDYRHGPAKRWQDRPWDAFRFVLSKEECDCRFQSSFADMQIDASEKTEKTGADEEVTGWEIWHKAKREVLFVRDDGVILAQMPDPLKLTQFFPIPTPMQPIELTGRLKPVNPFAIYKKLADQLDTITKRIDRLLNQLKVKGWYSGSATDLQNVLSLEDNEFAPIADDEIWAQNGGLQGAIAFWPIDKIIAALRELYPARDQTKQAIYEITGISDIVRGASVASETATAQNIKSQWGSLRIQKMQRMMERTARDLFVMMSEIIPMFSFKTLEEITNIPILPAPGDDEQTAAKKQAVMALLKRRAASYYRIDVESDSTVRADLTRQKQEVAEFLQGASAYFSAVAPLVQQGALPADAAVDIFAATARMFNLGKSVEDTLENMVTNAKAQAQQAQKAAEEAKNNPQPTPEQQAQQAEAQAKQQEFAGKMALLQKEAEGMDRKQAADAALAQLTQALKEIELDIRRVDLAIKNADLAAKVAAPAQTANEMEPA